MTENTSSMAFRRMDSFEGAMALIDILYNLCYFIDDTKKSVFLFDKKHIIL
mgnify:CR=1 FL=1